jgi:N-acetylmuramoyl-L-alanine amidase
MLYSENKILMSRYILKLTGYIYLFIFIIITATVLPSNLSGSEQRLNIIISEKNRYISIYDFTGLFDVHNSYDIVTGRGKLLYKGAVAIYQLGFSAMLINSRIAKADYPVGKIKGEIVFPVKFITDIIDNFYPEYFCIEKNNQLYISGKPESRSAANLQPKKETETTPSNQKDADRITFLIIDPGHGGKDPGAIGKGGIKEKWITLQIAANLDEYLKTRLKDIRIISTRKSDKFIELAGRTEIANRMLKKNENGIFISIHVNASIMPGVSGFETYFLSQNPSNDEARATAALENNVIILENNSRRKAYEDVEHVEAIMLTTQIQKESRMLANSIQKSMAITIYESNSKGVKNADFFVLRGSLMPAVLVEVGYISSIKELKRLKDRKYQKKIAEGIGDGIMRFIKEYNRYIKK